MKKIIGILGVVAFAMAMFLNTNFKNNSNDDLALENVIAINEANAEDFCITCSSSSSVCAWVEGYGNVYGTVTSIGWC